MEAILTIELSEPQHLHWPLDVDLTPTTSSDTTSTQRRRTKNDPSMFPFVDTRHVTRYSE